MKKLLFIYLLLPLSTFAQLNENGKIIKEKFPESYEYQKSRAEKEWGEDYKMVIYEINIQADAIIGFIDDRLIAKNYKIFINALSSWADPSEFEFNTQVMNLAGKQKTIDDFVTVLLMSRADWRMVRYEYDNQLNAKNEL